jgi:hypothetical protein
LHASELARVRVGLVAAEYARVDLGVGALAKRLEEQHDRHEELLLLDRQAQRRAARREQVQPHCL